MCKGEGRVYMYVALVYTIIFEDMFDVMRQNRGK